MATNFDLEQERAASQENAVILERIEELERIKTRSTREGRIKEARKLGYSVVVHSATGVVGSSR